MRLKKQLSIDSHLCEVQRHAKETVQRCS